VLAGSANVPLAAGRRGARHTAVIPYLGYARQDRLPVRRVITTDSVCVGAETVDALGLERLSLALLLGEAQVGRHRAPGLRVRSDRHAGYL
jgi:hypothetical protein